MEEMALFENPALWTALQAIVESPSQRLHASVDFVNIGEARTIEPPLLGVAAAQPGAIVKTARRGHLGRKGQRYRFIRVYERHLRREISTPENLFVGQFIETAQRRLRQRLSQTADEAMITRLARALRRLNAIYQALPMSFKFAQHPPIPVQNARLQFDARYNVIWKTWIQLNTHHQ